MHYSSVLETAKRWDLSERSVRNYCAQGRVDGAFLTGKSWNIPNDAEKPERSNKRTEEPRTLLEILKVEKESRYPGGIYHKTQIELTYNSNHIEGSRLTHDQTRYIFETNTLGITTEDTSVDDIMETVNHFRCIDYVIDHATDKITEAHIKALHAILKTNTSESRKPWFAVGDYKRLANEVGEQETVAPKEVHRHIKVLLSDYNALKQVTFDDILDFHVRFERIHPFQDGNGRVGRLLLFWQCLQNAQVPFIITDKLRLYYYRGLQHWGDTNGYLRDTCLTAQDNYKALLDYFEIRY